MAFIVGLASPEEITELKRRGWDIEKPPRSLGVSEVEGCRRIMIFVDANVIDIMSGPDWDHGPTPDPVECCMQKKGCKKRAHKAVAYQINGEWACEHCFNGSSTKKERNVCRKK